MSSVEIPEHLTIELTQVARYRAFEETAGGFALPDSESTDRHFFFSLPGAIALPAMIYYRTRHTGKPAFLGQNQRRYGDPVHLRGRRRGRTHLARDHSREHQCRSHTPARR